MSKVTITIAQDDDDTGFSHTHEVETIIPELLFWWLETSLSDFKATTPKIEEYGLGGNEVDSGSADLRLIGEGLAELVGWQEAPEELVQELGCWAYLHGKTARCIANYKQQQPAKPDTIFDMTIYSMMMRRLQAVGRWP